MDILGFDDSHVCLFCLCIEKFVKMILLEEKEMRRLARREAEAGGQARALAPPHCTHTRGYFDLWRPSLARS